MPPLVLLFIILKEVVLALEIISNPLPFLFPFNEKLVPVALEIISNPLPSLLPFNEKLTPLFVAWMYKPELPSPLANVKLIPVPESEISKCDPVTGLIKDDEIYLFQMN